MSTRVVRAALCLGLMTMGVPAVEQSGLLDVKQQGDFLLIADKAEMNAISRPTATRLKSW